MDEVKFGVYCVFLPLLSRNAGLLLSLPDSMLMKLTRIYDTYSYNRNYYDRNIKKYVVIKVLKNTPKCKKSYLSS